MKRFRGAAIVRHQVFALADGTVVVQWDDKRVQELLTGEYREFDHLRDFGHAITDQELLQLKANGRVEHYNRQYVWLNALPERGRFANRRTLDRGNRLRIYYLSTLLSASQKTLVDQLIDRAGLGEHVEAHTHEGRVIITAPGSQNFSESATVEQFQQQLSLHDNHLLKDSVIAFADIDPRSPAVEAPQEEELNLDELIASQQDTSLTAGKRLVLAVKEVEERHAYRDLLNDMKIEVLEAASGIEALELLEDNQTDLLVMDIQLDDLHAYQLLSKAREIAGLRDLPVILITEEPNMSTTIARADYLLRPVSISRLRHNIWKLLHDRELIARPPSRPTRL